MDFYQALTRKSQEEFWTMYEAELKKAPTEPEIASIKTYEKFKALHRHNLTYIEHWAFLGHETLEPSECPLCKDVQIKVIYAGFPFKLCCNEDCFNVTGFWSWVPHIYFNGIFFPYVGSYWQNLYAWLTSDFDTIE